MQFMNGTRLPSRAKKKKKLKRLEIESFAIHFFKQIKYYLLPPFC